jgi:hypothetical protein
MIKHVATQVELSLWFLSEMTPQPLFAKISSLADPPDGEGGVEHYLQVSQLDRLRTLRYMGCTNVQELIRDLQATHEIITNEYQEMAVF